MTYSTKLHLWLNEDMIDEFLFGTSIECYRELSMEDINDNKHICDYTKWYYEVMDQLSFDLFHKQTRS